MANILSYTQVIEILKDIAKRHNNINTFFLGRNWEIGEEETIIYPALQVYAEEATLPSLNGEYKTLEIKLNCKVLDLVQQDEENEKDVHSDTLRIAQDIINELNQHPYYIRSNASLIGDISLSTLEEFEDDFCSGWEFVIRLKLINTNSYCGLPFEEITGYAASGPTSTGYSTSTQYLTCETVTACTSISNLIHSIVLTSTTTSADYFGITLDGGGGVISTGNKGYFSIPFSGTIQSWTMVADQTGTCVVDIWKTNAAVPTVANTITASAKPTLYATQYSSSTNVSTWTTSINANDVFGYYVDSATGVTRVNLTIKITK